MPERRLLVLSYFFPPMLEPEAMLAAKRLARLPGWRSDVIAAAAHHAAMPTDPDLAAYSERAVNSVTRIRPWRLPWHRLGPIGRMPDGYRFLARQALRAAETLDASGCDAMLSWATSHASHLVALRLKRKYPRLPWLAHFSDPWVDNPFSTSGRVVRRINESLERQVIEAADRLLFTTPETVDLVMAKYPAAWRTKTRVIPHGFDPTLYTNEAPPAAAGRKLVLRYLGNFYGARTPDPLFRTLAAALKRRPSLAGELSVEIIGRLDAGMEKSAAASELPQGMVTVKPPIGYRESLRLMQTADLLLVVDAPADLSVFLPSKLVDYIGARRPILALTPRGASARVLNEAGYSVADPRDAEAGASLLLDLLARDGVPAAHIRARESYSSGVTGAQLAAVLAELSPA